MKYNKKLPIYVFSKQVKAIKYGKSVTLYNKCLTLIKKIIFKTVRRQKYKRQNQIILRYIKKNILLVKYFRENKNSSHFFKCN